MKKHRWSELRKRTFTPDEIAETDRRVEQEIIDLNLRALRELVGKTQVDVAAQADLSQSDVSKIERRQDHRLSTLRRYVEALGGELEVIARFGDKSIKLHGV